MRWELKLSILFVALGIALMGVYCLVTFWAHLMPVLDVFANKYPVATKILPLLSPIAIVFAVIFNVIAKKSKAHADA